MSLEQEIRDHVAAYLKGKASLSALSKWIADIGWDVEDSDDTKAKSLFLKVELAVYDHIHSSRADSDLKNELNALLGTVVLDVSFVPAGKKTLLLHIKPSEPLLAEQFQFGGVRGSTVLCPGIPQTNRAQILQLDPVHS